MSFDNAIIFVKIHNLVHDLALSVAGKDVLHIKYDTRNIFEGTRHLLFSAVRLEGKEFPRFLLKLNKLRTFSFHFKVGPISKTCLDTLIKNFSCLRSLELGGSEFEELPSSIGTLKHLRFLNLKINRNIKALPITICNLVNLQTLCLSGCVMLQDLPRDFGNMLSLRTLYLTSKMTCFPKKGHAEGLRSLQCLWIENCDHLESLLGGMKNLTALRRLYIYECPSLTSFPAESLRYLTSLETLWILKCEKLNFLEEEDTMMELPRGLLSLVLQGIPKVKELPHGFENAAATIKYIRIDDCSLEILPEWLQKCASLSKLELINCMLLESLLLGMHQLTALRKLRIENCSRNLSRKCERGTGEYWPWISHIPEIHLKWHKSKKYLSFFIYNQCLQQSDPSNATQGMKKVYSVLCNRVASLYTRLLLTEYKPHIKCQIDTLPGPSFGSEQPSVISITRLLTAEYNIATLDCSQPNEGPKSISI
ncbi:hypothetical protein LguiA_026365 [Lonicera macranthoides]